MHEDIEGYDDNGQIPSYSGTGIISAGGYPLENAVAKAKLQAGVGNCFRVW